MLFCDVSQTFCLEWTASFGSSLHILHMQNENQKNWNNFQQKDSVKLPVWIGMPITGEPAYASIVAAPLESTPAEEPAANTIIQTPASSPSANTVIGSATQNITMAPQPVSPQEDASNRAPIEAVSPSALAPEGANDTSSAVITSPQTASDTNMAPTSETATALSPEITAQNNDSSGAPGPESVQGLSDVGISPSQVPSAPDVSKAAGPSQEVTTSSLPNGQASGPSRTQASATGVGTSATSPPQSSSSSSGAAIGGGEPLSLWHIIVSWS